MDSVCHSLWRFQAEKLEFFSQNSLAQERILLSFKRQSKNSVLQGQFYNWLTIYASSNGKTKIVLLFQWTGKYVILYFLGKQSKTVSIFILKNSRLIKHCTMCWGCTLFTCKASLLASSLLHPFACESPWETTAFWLSKSCASSRESVVAEACGGTALPYL